jgi:hypothetical protein
LEAEVFDLVASTALLGLRFPDVDLRAFHQILRGTFDVIHLAKSKNRMIVDSF